MTTAKPWTTPNEIGLVVYLRNSQLAKLVQEANRSKTAQTKYYYFVTMEFQLLPEVTELQSKNSLLRLKSSHPAISKQTSSMGFPAVTVFGADWRNKQMPSNAGKQNMSEMSSIAAKAPTFPTMHG